jgi:hypothetical protein
LPDRDSLDRELGKELIPATGRSPICFLQIDSVTLKSSKDLGGINRDLEAQFDAAHGLVSKQSKMGGKALLQ